LRHRRAAAQQENGVAHTLRDHPGSWCPSENRCFPAQKRRDAATRADALAGDRPRGRASM
jgi:hypothetical protein